MVDFYLKVYNGMRYFSFVIENDKLGFLVGEFSPTKKRAFKKKKIAVKKKEI
jgi:ribosomal protein S19